jgi:hypothetical protein
MREDLRPHLSCSFSAVPAMPVSFKPTVAVENRRAVGRVQQKTTGVPSGIPFQDPNKSQVFNRGVFNVNY